MTKCSLEKVPRKSKTGITFTLGHSKMGKEAFSRCFHPHYSSVVFSAKNPGNYLPENSVKIVLMISFALLFRRLDSNPLICDCRLSWLRTFFIESEGSVQISASCIDKESGQATSLEATSEAQFECCELTLNIRYENLVHFHKFS